MVENYLKKLVDRISAKKIHYFNSFIIFCPLHIHGFFCMDMFYR